MLYKLNTRFKHILITVITLLLFHWSSAQYFEFSEEKDVFVNDIVAGISALGTESANKVAYDFRNIWSAQITNTQKTKIINITQKLRKRRFKTRPYFIHFFGLVTYAITQKEITGEKLSRLLQVVDNSVINYDARKLAEVLKTLHFFFARGYLYFSHFNTVKVENGTFDFELKEEETEEKFISLYEEDEGQSDEENDEWGDEEGWSDEGDDGWGDEEDDWENNEEDETIKPVFNRTKVESEFKRDYVEEIRINDIEPPLIGGIIKIENADITITSPFDTLKLKNTSGSFVIKTEDFIGKGGIYEWPSGFQNIKGAKVVLKAYHFKTFRPELWTSKASLLMPNLFKDSLLGVFRFKSKNWKNYNNRSYPRFKSNYSDKEISISGDNVYYKGGLSLIGNKMYGTSISRNLGFIKILDYSGRTIISEAVKYEFKDSIIFSDNSSIIIYHSKDSIYHPAVQFKFDISKNKLTLIKEKKNYSHIYYHSSLLEMKFKIDLLEWDLNSDSLYLSIMNARNIVPALFESNEYFNPIKYEKMTGLFGFHPVLIVVAYSRKINGKEYNIVELENTYPVNKNILRSAILYLKQTGFVEFDEQTGDIKVKREAFHYVLSYSKKKDYDNILISSLSTGKPNALFNLADEELHITGVKYIFITPDLDARIQPDSGAVTLLKDKNIHFNGSVEAGDFRYKGHNFEFDYDQFLVNMPIIDSIQIKISDYDSTEIKANDDKSVLSNQITETAGVLYINKPNNKANFKEYAQYPYFESDSEAVVYFNSPDILNNAYNKSIKFVIPPFKMDSINREDKTTIKFEGKFIGGGILPDFEETLIIMPDKSLGFEHKIPQEGYKLYGGEGIVYNDLKLNGNGLRVNGKIDYKTTTVYSNDFIFYMDSVSTLGSGGIIREGNLGGSSYPEVIWETYKMKWLPLKDNMYIENIENPFKFYNATAFLNGKINITAKGVFGSGEMLSRESRSVSDKFEFGQFFYFARHAKFEILTDIEDKPAMQGDNISMYFDLKENIADIHPEQIGVAAISFPYAQMKTSITDAIWYLDSAKITMNKPENVRIESSYFYSTREELDSLAFNAESATYYIDTYQLHVKGIPFIKVADAEIIPDNYETTILANSELQQFKNAKLKIDTLNGYHNFYDGDIKILSRNKFEGNATYQLVTAAQDTFAIKFKNFELKDFKIGKDEFITMTVSSGTVDENKNLQIVPGFLFKGTTTMYADRKALELNGFAKLNIKSIPDYNYWIKFASFGDSTDVNIHVGTAITEDGNFVEAGLVYDGITNQIYPNFVNHRKRQDDIYLFKAEGELTHDYKTNNYFIETSSKSALDTYSGKTFIYNDDTKNVIFEGLIDFIQNDENYALTASVLGSAQPDSEFYTIDAFITFQMKLNQLIVESMASDILDIIERLGADVAHDNDVKLIYKLSNIVGDQPSKEYENESLKNYIPLYESGLQVEKNLVISNIDMRWSDTHKGWYNTSRIGFSNILKNDINALVDGFLEIKKSDTGGDIVNLFLQIAPSTWYYFGYVNKRLSIYSSNSDFNALVIEYSNIEKTGFGEYTTVIGDEVEVVKFINDFRFNYFGIAEEYQLEFPSDIMLESEGGTFDTIVDEKEEENTELDEEDDGF